MLASPNLYMVKLKANRLQALGLIAEKGCSEIANRAIIHSRIKAIINSDRLRPFLLHDGVARFELSRVGVSEEADRLLMSSV